MWRPAKFMPPGPQITIRAKRSCEFMVLLTLKSAFIPNGIETKGMIFTYHFIYRHSIISGYWKEMYMKAFSVIVDELFAKLSFKTERAAAVY